MAVGMPYLWRACCNQWISSYDGEMFKRKQKDLVSFDNGKVWTFSCKPCHVVFQSSVSRFVLQFVEGS